MKNMIEAQRCTAHEARETLNHLHDTKTLIIASVVAAQAGGIHISEPASVLYAGIFQQLTGVEMWFQGIRLTGIWSSLDIPKAEKK